MSSKFTYLKGNCPICAGTSKQCRQSKDTDRVHCRGEVATVPLGWESKGVDVWGFEMYAESSSNQEDASERLKRQQRLAQKRQREKEELAKGALPPAERDKAIRRIRGEFGLSHKHHQNLFNRGLTQNHIDRLPYFSFIDKQEVPHFTPANLPGVRYGRLAVKGTGFACPIPNIDGLIIGWQYRFDDSTETRYRWPSGEKSIHLANGELPIGVYRPDKGITPQRFIGHAEGFLKSDIIAQKWRLPVLGAASANFTASSEQWKLSLEKLSVELETKNILWFADAGSVRNHHVIAQYRKAWKQLIEWGYSVFIVWYNQNEKSAGDADEISEAVRESAQVITINDYLNIVKQHKTHVEQNQTTEADSLNSTKYEANIQREPDSNQYETYTKWEAEEELFAEAEEERRDEIKKENICNFVKSKIRNLKRFSNWKKNLEKSGKELPTIPEAKNEIVYHPNKEFPNYEDFKKNGLTPPKIIFDEGQRLEVIVRSMKAGWPYVKDSSFMGLGKSHDSGNFYPGNGDDNNDDLENETDAETESKRTISTVWYLDVNHTNPSTITVESMTNMMPRHDGMSFVEGKFTPSGKPHLRHTKEGQTPDIPRNCPSAKLFNLLQQKGYDPNAEKKSVTGEDGKNKERNQICIACSEINNCHTGVNGKSGYFFQREETFVSDRIRASINSLPPDGNFSKDVAFIEEASSYLRGTAALTATESDINNLFIRLQRQDSETFTLLTPVIHALTDAFNGEFNRIIKGINRGADHDALMSNLPSPQQILNLSFENEEEEYQAKLNLLNAVKATIPTVKEIIQKPDSVTGLRGKLRAAGETVRRLMKAEAHRQTEENIENLPPNILGDFIAVWLGLKRGALRIDGKKLTVTTVSTKHADILNQMKFAALLDATGDKNHLAKILGLHPNDILEIVQKTPNLSNLEVVNINMPGMGSRNVSDECKKRQTIFLNWVKENHWDASIKVLGYKNDKHLPIDGHWFHDNRATNAFKQTKVLVVYNSPRMNLGVAQDEYRTIYGSLDGFEEYYRNLMKDEVIQLIGRQRAHLDPDCKYIIYLVGTNQNVAYLTDELGIRVINKQMIEVCPEAAKAGERTLKDIFDICWKAAKDGSLAHLTTTSVGDAIGGKCKQLVSKTIKPLFGTWENFKRCLLHLLDLYRFGRQAKDWDALYDVDDAVVGELETLAHIYLPAEVKSTPPDKLLEQISSIWKYGDAAFNKLMTLLPSDVRQKLAQTMLVALGSDFVEEIRREFDEGIP